MHANAVQACMRCEGAGCQCLMHDGSAGYSSTWGVMRAGARASREHGLPDDRFEGRAGAVRHLLPVLCTTCRLLVLTRLMSNAPPIRNGQLQLKSGLFVCAATSL
jgi:hypothetical protein